MKNSLIILKKYSCIPIERYKIPSKSQPGTFHIVKHYQNGEWNCDCIAFFMGVQCKHILEAQQIWKNKNKSNN